MTRGDEGRPELLCGAGGMRGRWQTQECGVCCGEDSSRAYIMS